MIQIKRAYEPALTTDGRRVLVERLWPRGLRKEDAHLDDWLKDVAPSDSLRKWFGHDPARFREFRERYRRELHSKTSKGALDELARQAAHEKVTLVYSARDEEHNSAAVLAGELERRFRRPSKPTAATPRSRTASRARPRVGRGR